MSDATRKQIRRFAEPPDALQVGFMLIGYLQFTRWPVAASQCKIKYYFWARDSISEPEIARYTIAGLEIMFTLTGRAAKGHRRFTVGIQ